MPKLVGMAQLSRPYQIALGVLVLFAAVWAVALRGHSSSPTSSTPVAAAPAQTTPATTKPATPAKGSGSSIYHGSAPGVQGLTRAIAKAHGAVATSEQNAKQLAERSAQASNANSPGTGTSTASTSSSAAPSAATAAPKVTHTAVKQPAAKPKSATASTTARQVLVEKALHQGKVAVILFWNPKGFDDMVVHTEVRLLDAIHNKVKAVDGEAKVRREIKLSGLEFQKPIATFDAKASEVAAFGSITRGVQVYGTPTILVVDKSGKTTVLTGLSDVYSIEQAIDEARHA